jgi:formate-dependent nitrite reductase cytochrome c552 subunit
VAACTSCHADQHTLAFEGSPHHRLWQQAQAGEIPAEQGVSCASCHMPRIDYDVNDWMSRVMVDHNQSASLSPNSKMIRPACLHCHGLGFSIDALADRALIDRNFAGQPEVPVDTMALAEQEQQRRQEKSGGDRAGMFGF